MAEEFQNNLDSTNDSELMEKFSRIALFYDIILHITR